MNTEIKLPPRNNTNFPLAVQEFLKSVQWSPTDILQHHQQIINHYFIKNRNHRGLLIFHGTGYGKTMLSVSIAEILKNTYNVVILSPKSLQNTFMKEVDRYSKLTGITGVEDYVYLSSNAGNMRKKLTELDKSVEELEFENSLELFNTSIKLDNTLLIMDEAHHIFNGIANEAKNAIALYESIMKAKNIKLIFMTATPITNDPFELVSVFNMLHGSELFPREYDDFHKYYVNETAIKNSNIFKNRIFGLVSYMGDLWKTSNSLDTKSIIKRPLFPDQYPTTVEIIPMSQQQFAAYASARDIETRARPGSIMKKSSAKVQGSYRVRSRQASNFLPSPDVPDSHLMNLDVYSPKMKKILENINKHPGLSIVYSSFVTTEGLNLFSRVLKANGWREYGDRTEAKKFAFYTGDVPSDERSAIVSKFIDRDNKEGKHINTLLLSGAGAEGLDLRNIRSVHIMEPFWHYGRIQQVIARAVRFKSHEDFKDAGDKTVHPYIYISDYPTDYKFVPTNYVKTQEKTTDVHLYEKSIHGKILIDSFYNALIEASIDCAIHSAKSPTSTIKCLQCSPTNNPLFGKDISNDLKFKNPCEEPSRESVSAKEIIFQDKTYYYTSGDVIDIYEFDKTLNSYMELSKAHPHYAAIIEQIELKV